MLYLFFVINSSKILCFIVAKMTHCAVGDKIVELIKNDIKEIFVYIQKRAKNHLEKF